MAISTIKQTANMAIQWGVVDYTGSSGVWVYHQVTFDVPYKHTPMVSVNQYETAYATDLTMPMIDRITTYGFRFGWYNTNKKRTVIWQAIGEI